MNGQYSLEAAMNYTKPRPKSANNTNVRHSSEINKRINAAQQQAKATIRSAEPNVNIDYQNNRISRYIPVYKVLKYHKYVH